MTDSEYHLDISQVNGVNNTYNLHEAALFLKLLLLLHTDNTVIFSECSEALQYA